MLLIYFLLCFGVTFAHSENEVPSRAQNFEETLQNIDKAKYTNLQRDKRFITGYLVPQQNVTIHPGWRSNVTREFVANVTQSTTTTTRPEDNEVIYPQPVNGTNNYTSINLGLSGNVSRHEYPFSSKYNVRHGHHHRYPGSGSSYPSFRPDHSYPSSKPVHNYPTFKPVYPTPSNVYPGYYNNPWLNGFLAPNSGYLVINNGNPIPINFYPAPNTALPAPNIAYPAVNSTSYNPVANHDYSASIIGYPAPNNVYPAPNYVHLVPNYGYPATSNGYPPTSNGYPPTSNGYPPTSNGYPPTSNGYPPTSNGYPPTSNDYPAPNNVHQVPNYGYSAINNGGVLSGSSDYATTNNSTTTPAPASTLN